MIVEIRTLPTVGSPCANRRCTNRMGEGAWTLLDIQGDPDARHLWERRGLSLSMCSPCSVLLMRQTDANGTRAEAAPGERRSEP